MTNLTQGWADRCLPLRIANQNGWWILNHSDFEVWWDGGVHLDSIKFRCEDGQPLWASSLFGFGMVTWFFPYLIQTSPGFNLGVRGPANFFKDGSAPLEGIVETDWLPYPFTMSWKITRAGQWIRFKEEEPVCQIIPIKRGDVESFQPQLLNLESAEELHARNVAWTERRKAIRDASQGGTVALPAEGHYMRGTGLLRERAPLPFTPPEPKPLIQKEPQPGENPVPPQCKFTHQPKAFDGCGLSR